MGTLIFIVAALAIMGDSADWVEDHYEFRKSQFDAERLMVRGDLKYMRRLGAGLTITIPANAVGQAISVSANRQVVGNCEITASFDLLTIPRNSRASLSGVGLEIRSDKQVTGIKLQNAKNGGREYAVYNYSDDNFKSISTEVFPAIADSMVFKIVREGPIIRYLVSEGPSEDYRDLHMLHFSDLPIRPVHIFTEQRGGSIAMKVCWHELHIRAESFYEAGQKVAEPSFFLKRVLLGSLFLLFASGLGITWWTINS